MASDDQNEQPGVLLDTNALIYLSDEASVYGASTISHFRAYIERGFGLFLSQLTVAEYLVRSELKDLPLHLLYQLNFDGASTRKAGEIGRFLYDERKRLPADAVSQPEELRTTIGIDMCLIAQAETNPRIQYVLAGDKQLLSRTARLATAKLIRITAIDAKQPYDPSRYGELF